jgi:hypothetical protein
MWIRNPYESAPQTKNYYLDVKKYRRVRTILEAKTETY